MSAPLYATRALLTARVGGTTNYNALTDDVAAATPNADIELILLDQTNLYVNGYLQRGGVTLPLAGDDLTYVQGIALDIANYKAKTRGDRVATEDDRLLYQAAIRLLEGIADKSILLPGGGATAPFTGDALFDSEERIFSRRLLGPF